MKTNSTKVWRRVAFFLVLLSACHTTMAQMPMSMNKTPQGYGVDQRFVYYEGKIVQHADAASFVYLGYGYAKDRRFVYYKGVVLQHADVRTFKVVGDMPDTRYDDYYPNRRPSVHPRYEYPDGWLPDEALPGKSLGYGYSKTDFEVFYYGTKMNDVFNPSFEVLIDGYAKDGFAVYFEGKKIPDCSSSSFKCLGNGVGADDFYKYYWGKRIRK